MDSLRGSQLVAYGARATALAVAAVLALAPVAAPGQDAPPEPDGYRQDDYRAPTPAGLQGARTVTTAEAEKLWRGRAAPFVGGMPHVPRPRNPPPGTILRRKPRVHNPASARLPANASPPHA